MRFIRKLKMFIHSICCCYFFGFRGEGDIERNKGSSASLKDHSKEASISHLDSDAQVNLDPSCSTDTTVCGSLNGNIGKSATLGSASTSGSSSTSSSGAKTKVERRESARLASSATKFLRSLRNHSGGGKLTASSVIAADDKHPINVIALKELDIETHSLNPGAAGSSYLGAGAASRGSAGGTASGKLPERSQSFNEKRLLVVTQNTSSENSAGTSGVTGNSAQVKVKHSRAQSFVCNNSNSRNKSGYSIYLNHQHQFQSTQQNQANLAKQQLLFDQTKHPTSVSGGVGDSGRRSQQGNHSSSPKGAGLVNTGGIKGDVTTNSEATSASTSSRAPNIHSCETIYENLEVILEEKHNKEQMKNKGNKDYSPKLGNISQQSGLPASSKCYSAAKSGEKQHEGAGSPTNNINKITDKSSGTSSKTASSSVESLDTNMRISGKERPCQITRKYNKDSGYETNSNYSNMALPKSSSVDSIISSRMMMDKQYSGERSKGSLEPRSNRIMNTSLYEELNVSSIPEGVQNSAKPNIGPLPGSGGSRKLRRSISEVPSERSTNLAKLQTKVGDSTARAMYTIANG